MMSHATTIDAISDKAIHDRISHLIIRSRPICNMNTSLPPPSSSFIETGVLPSFSPSSMSNNNKRRHHHHDAEDGQFYAWETFPTKHARVVSDETLLTRGWAASAANGANTIPTSGRSLMDRGLTPAPAIYGFLGGRGMLLDTYNQLPKVIPTPTDSLTVEDLTRPRTIGYIKQPFQPSNPSVVVYRPVVLLPRGPSPPLFTYSPGASMNNNNSGVIATNDNGLHHTATIRSQFQPPSYIMRTTGLRSSLNGQATDDLSLKSGLCRTSYTVDERFLSALGDHQKDVDCLRGVR